MVVRAITQAPAQAQDPVEIKFVHIFSDQQDFRSEVVLQIAQEFMAQNPNVTVTVEAPTSDYEELFNSALLAAEQGNAPHVVQVEESLTQLAVDSQLFVPISQVASEEQLADLEDYLPQVKAFFSVGEELWGLPWNTSTPLLYYNKNLFEAAGLDPNAPPTTFDEVLATCAAFQAAQLEGLDACMNWPLASWFPEQWMAMQNAVLVNNDNGRSARASEVLFTAPEMLNVLTWWQTMSDNDYYTYSGTPNDYNGDAIIFLGQSTAMHINSTAGVTLLKSFSAAQGFELGIAPLPLPSPEATNGLTVGGASLFISAGYSEAETQAAIDFAFFLTNTQNGATWHQGTGYFPNRQSTLDLLNEEGWFEANPDFAIGLQQVLDGQQNVATAGMVLGPAQQVRGFLIEAIQSVVDQGADPLEALEAAKGRADQALADYNALFE
jgi:sn-glycerol 3-phosphate transport system substrate-binding protein